MRATFNACRSVSSMSHVKTEAEESSGAGGHAVLAGPGLRDDTRLAQPLVSSARPSTLLILCEPAVSPACEHAHAAQVGKTRGPVSSEGRPQFRNRSRRRRQRLCRATGASRRPQPSRGPRGTRATKRPPKSPKTVLVKVLGVHHQSFLTRSGDIEPYGIRA